MSTSDKQIFFFSGKRDQLIETLKQSHRAIIQRDPSEPNDPMIYGATSNGTDLYHVITAVSRKVKNGVTEYLSETFQDLIAKGKIITTEGISGSGTSDRPIPIGDGDLTGYTAEDLTGILNELRANNLNPSKGTHNLNMSDGNGFFEESNVTQGFHGSIEVLNGLDVKKEKIEHSSTVFPSTIENEVIFGVRDNAGGLQNFLRIRSGSKRPQINLNGTAHDLGYESDIPQWTEWTKGSITLPNETGTWEISGYMASEVSNFIGRPNAVTGRGEEVCIKKYITKADGTASEGLGSEKNISLNAGEAMVDLRVTHKEGELFWLITGSLGGRLYPPNEDTMQVFNIQSSVRDTGYTCTLDRTNIYSYNGHVTELKYRKIV